MEKFFRSQKQNIIKLLRSFLVDQARALGRVDQEGKSAATKLYAFCSRGKMVRGGSVMLGWEMYKTRRAAAQADARRAAAAIELLHSSLLIHDDIMDNDELRRGEKTMFMQYAEGASVEFGKSMATCGGDIGFFLAFQLLGEIRSPNSASALIQLIGHELAAVATAQMQDLALATSKTLPSETAVLHLYKYKTARYTFSLPLRIGALLAGASGPELLKLEKFGEQLGLLFQLKDDELGLLGDEAQIGKPPGSDIREGKKTLHWLYLMKLAGAEEKRRLETVFQKQKLGAEELAMVRRAAEQLGVIDKVREKMGSFAASANRTLRGIKANETHKKILAELVANGLERER